MATRHVYPFEKLRVWESSRQLVKSVYNQLVIPSEAKRSRGTPWRSHRQLSRGPSTALRFAQDDCYELSA